MKLRLRLALDGVDAVGSLEAPILVPVELTMGGKYQAAAAGGRKEINE